MQPPSNTSTPATATTSTTASQASDAVSRQKQLDELLSRRPVPRIYSQASVREISSHHRRKAIEESRERLLRVVDPSGLQRLRELDAKLNAFRSKGAQLEQKKMTTATAAGTVTATPAARPPSADIPGSVTRAGISPVASAKSSADKAASQPTTNHNTATPHKRTTSRESRPLSVTTASAPVVDNRFKASAAASPTAQFLGVGAASPSRVAADVSTAKSSSVSVPSPQSLADDGQVPLENAWQILFDRRVHSANSRGASGAAYESNLVPICNRVDTVQKFWSYFNQLKQPSQIENNSNIHVFKADIKPMWEDPANSRGGRWTIDFADCPELVDASWLETILAAIGEGLDDTNELCGIVFSRRPRGDRLSVWIRSGVENSVIFNIGMRLLTLLNLFDAKIGMDFRYHSDSMRSGASFGGHGGQGKRLQLDLASLRSSNEALMKESRRRQVLDSM